MNRIVSVSLLASLTACAPDPSDPAAPARLIGTWMSASGTIDVEIAPCDAASGQSRLCGTITKVLDNHAMMAPGGPPSARNDVGLRIMTDFTPAGGDSFRGRLLNRESGKIYDCILRPGAAGEMVVHPYVIHPWFGQTQLWHRQTAAG